MMKTRGRKPKSALYAGTKRKQKRIVITRAHIERAKVAAARAQAKFEVGTPRLLPDETKNNFWIVEIDYQGKTLRMGSFSPKEYAARMAARCHSTLSIDKGQKAKRMPAVHRSADKLAVLERFK